MSIKSVKPSNNLLLWCPLILLPSVFSSIRVFSNESALHIRWPKYWSFSFSIIPSKEHPGLISFRMDWLELFAVHRTLKSLLQHYSFIESILPHSAFFMVQHSHSHIALRIWNSVGKVMSLLGNFLADLKLDKFQCFHFPVGANSWHPYMTTGKTIALTRRIFVGKVMCLLSNMLSRLVITLLPRSKRLLISWLQSPSAVILEPPKLSHYCFHCFPTYLP